MKRFMMMVAAMVLGLSTVGAATAAPKSIAPSTAQYVPAQGALLHGVNGRHHSGGFFFGHSNKFGNGIIAPRFSDRGFKRNRFSHRRGFRGDRGFRSNRGFRSHRGFRGGRNLGSRGFRRSRH